MQILPTIPSKIRPVRLGCCVAAVCLHVWMASASRAADDALHRHVALSQGALAFSIAPRSVPTPSPKLAAKPVMPVTPIVPRSPESLTEVAQKPSQMPALELRQKPAPDATPELTPEAVSEPTPALAMADTPDTASLPVSGMHELVELHEPRFISPPQPPHYPTLARKRGQQGTVWVAVQLDARGEQARRHVLSSSGVAVLDNAALLAVSRWQFRPYEVRGVGLPSRVRIPIEFSLN